MMPLPALTSSSTRKGSFGPARGQPACCRGEGYPQDSAFPGLLDCQLFWRSVTLWTDWCAVQS